MHNLANLWPFFLVFLDFCQEIISHSKISASWTRFSPSVFVNFSCHFRFFSQYSTFLESARAFCSFDSSLILRTPSSDFTIPLSPPTITCRYGQRSGVYFQSLQKLNLSDLSNLVTIPSCSTHLISPPLQQCRCGCVCKLAFSMPWWVAACPLSLCTFHPAHPPLYSARESPGIHCHPHASTATTALWSRVVPSRKQWAPTQELMVSHSHSSPKCKNLQSNQSFCMGHLTSSPGRMNAE